MEPGHEDREYGLPVAVLGVDRDASMEPGHEDREYALGGVATMALAERPQWSPVMKTGNTYIKRGWITPEE